MNSITKLFSICIALCFLSCSDDDNSNNQNDVSTGPKSNVSIKATTTFNASSGRAKSANGLQLDAFYINISEIEFEYADASKPSYGFTKSDDEDEDLTFEELPQEIKDYLNQNHPNDAFCKAEMEEDDDEPYKYEVELESGLELYFKSDFTLYAQEQDDEPCGFDDSDDDDPSNSYGEDDEFELAGPFELNLLDAETTTIVNVDIPQGIYEEVEFKMERSNVSGSVLYQKSMLITGTLNGIPMTFFHTFEEDFEVDYEDAGQNLIIDDSNNNEVTFNFDLNAVVNTVDFSSATDGNSDGTIEISPSDTDGNNILANQIKSAIVQYAELID